MSDVYTTSDIVNGIGIKLETLHGWLKKGVLSPTIQKASGIGTKNLFNKKDYLQAQILKFLILELGLGNWDAMRASRRILETKGAAAFISEEEKIKVTVDATKVFK